MDEAALSTPNAAICAVCDDDTHAATRCPTPAGLLHRLADASVALGVAETPQDLLRIATAQLQALTGAFRVDASLVHPIDVTAATEEVRAPDDSRAPLVLALRSRRGERLGEVRLHPGPEPFGAEVVALAVAVGNGISLLLDNMALVEALQEQVRRQDRLLATVAHVVRQPLTPIVHAASQLGQGAQREPQVQRAHEVISREAAKAVRLLDDLTDLRQLDANALPLYPATCRLGDALAAALAAVRPAAEARGVVLRAHLPPHAVLLRADPQRLVRLVVILLDNAVRFSQPTGVVTVHATCSDGRVRVAVRDEGTGIPPHALEAVFTPMAAVGAPHGPGRDGLGISLALARGLAVRHGGTLTAHSEGIGHGSTFVLRLPGAPATQDLLQAVTPPTRHAGALRPGLRILVVDDNRDAADALALLLARDGHHVCTCYDGPSAARRQLDDPHDVVLLDIGLPGASGHDVARTIRAAERDREVPSLLVALTGWGQAPDRRRSFEAGCDHHLVKPVSYPALRALLGHWRQGRHEAGASPGARLPQ